VYKVSPHDKLPFPNVEDYNLDPDTYDRVFFQEDGLEGQFELDLTEPIKMKVDIEIVVDEEEEDEVQNENDLEILEGNDINDEFAPSDGVNYEMVDSNDETYDPANSNTYKVYFNRCNAIFFYFVFVSKYIFFIYAYLLTLNYRLLDKDDERWD
jgi:hypothetical protein